MAELAVEAQGLGKAYRLYGGAHRRLLEMCSFGRWRGHREHWALRDLDLALPRGSVLGICGANGAGKSTLLRVLSGTTPPTEGRFRTAGRVTSLLELGMGFDGRLSGRANLRHSAMTLGYTRREVDAKTDAIVEFSELGAFIEEPLFTYSSGMAMRLGFSLAAMLEPEVLVLDEVFAVGDVAFQKKCAERMYAFKDENRTILFCSHSIFDLRQLCDEALWIDGGREAARGGVVEVTDRYLQSVRSADDLEPRPDAGRAGDGSVRADLAHILDVRVYAMGEERELHEIRTGDSIEVRVWWRQPEGSEDELNLGVGLVREDNTICVGLATHFEDVRLRGVEGCAILRLPELELLAGRYLVPVWLLDRKGGLRLHETLAQERLVVRSNTPQQGVYAPRHAWSLVEGARPPERG